MDYLQTLTELSPPKAVVRGSIIITENTGGPYSMYVITKGSVNVYKNYGDYNEVMVATLRSGDFFGEMSFYLGQPRAATVVAAEDSQILEIDESNAQAVLKGCPTFTEIVIRSLCTRIADLNQRLSAKYNRL